jgi:hypothetical protein
VKYYLHNLQKTIDKRGYFYFIAFMIMASAFLPLVFNNLPAFIRSHHIWTITWFVSILIFYPRVFINKLVLILLFYGLIFVLILQNTLYVNIDDWNKRQILQEFYEISVAISVLAYFQIEKDFIRFAKLVKWTMAFIFITAIMTIVTSILAPNYARDMVGLSDSISKREVVRILSYKKYGGGSYGFAGAILCLFPILVYYFKNNLECPINKKYIIIFSIVLFISLTRIQLFANILISVVVIVASILSSKNVNRSIIIISLAILALLLIPMQYYADILVYISKWFPKDSQIHFKLNETSKYILFGDSQPSAIAGRAERYPLLIKSFIQNPLLGHFSTNRIYDISSGAHLQWMYKLSAYGLVGSIPFFYILYEFIKGNIKYFNKEFIIYFILSTFSIIILGSMKVVAGRETWYAFFIILPGLYYFPLLKRKII